MLFSIAYVASRQMDSSSSSGVDRDDPASFDTIILLSGTSTAARLSCTAARRCTDSSSVIGA